MVECGSPTDPPSFSNITIWGIFTFLCMLFIGGHSVYGLINAFRFNSKVFLDILSIAEYGFGVAGLVFIILSIVRKSGANMKIGMFCYLSSCILAIVILIIYLAWVGWYASFFVRYLFHLGVCFFLTYIFYQQSKKVESTQ